MNAVMQYLGSDFQSLKPIVQEAHSGDIKLEGKVAVRRGWGLAWLIGAVLGMPRSNAQEDLIVFGSHTKTKMIWRRTFGDFDGIGLVGRGQNVTEMTSFFEVVGPFFVEYFGPFRLHFKLSCEDGDLVYRLQEVRLGGIRLPSWLSPTVEAFESEQEGGYQFGVRVVLPVLGRLIEYGGVMELEHCVDLI